MVVDSSSVPSVVVGVFSLSSVTDMELYTITSSGGVSLSFLGPWMKSYYL